jgi:hypothetical protein
MSYQEKKIIASILSGMVILASYCIYAFGKYQAGLVTPGDLKFWASTMLIFIGIGIVVTIAIMLVFQIMLSIAIAVKEKIRDENFDEKLIEKTIKVEMVEDEMDKLIELKSSKVGYAFSGIGLVAGLLSLVFNYAPMVMLNIIFLSFSGGSIVEGFTQLYFYRKGI